MPRSAGAVREGGCLCGAVRLTLHGMSEAAVACHCDQCRRWTGSALVVAEVPPGGLEVAGEAAVGRHLTRRAERAFCVRCGSSLWFRYLNRADAPYDVCLGILDDAEGIGMVREIWIDRKPGAYAFAGDHARETGAERDARRRREGAEP